jgi:hypothetical protein
LQEQHRHLDVEQMLAALARRLFRRMQRKAEEGEAAHAGQRRRGLRLRRHPAAERFAAGDQRQFRQSFGASATAARTAACASFGGSGRLLPRSM